jgi:hypothetical protein
MGCLQVEVASHVNSFFEVLLIFGDSSLRSE